MSPAVAVRDATFLGVSPGRKHHRMTQQVTRVAAHPAPADPDDRFGDKLQNGGEHTSRHNDVNAVWEEACMCTFGTPKIPPNELYTFHSYGGP